MSTNDRPDDPSACRPAAAHAVGPRYEICVRGRLGSRWSAWFDGMTVTDANDGTTVICGPVIDQAALHGQLQKLRDLGIPLLSLTQHDPGETDHESATGPRHPRPNPSGATS